MENKGVGEHLTLHVRRLHSARSVMWESWLVDVCDKWPQTISKKVSIIGMFCEIKAMIYCWFEYKMVQKQPVKHEIFFSCNTKVVVGCMSSRIFYWKLCECMYGVFMFFSSSPIFFSQQVAIIAGNFELAELIKNHKDSDIGESQSSRFSLHLYHLLIPHLFFQSHQACIPESHLGYISNPLAFDPP